MNEWPTTVGEREEAGQVLGDGQAEDGDEDEDSIIDCIIDCLTK